MQTISWAVQIGLWLMLGLLGLGQQLAWAAEGGIEYRFERMVPQLEQPISFNSPYAITVALDGSVWVADTGNNRLQHFSATGEFITTVGGNGVENGQFNQPYGISVASDGSVWVADTYNHRLQHFSATGKFIEKIGAEGSLHGQFQYPSGISVAADGSLWITDSDNNRLQHMSSSGQFIAEVGSKGSELGKFNLPMGIAIASDGSLWVTDLGNHRIQHLTQDGNFIATVGSEGNKNGQFNKPYGISVAKDGSVWVADTLNHRFQHISVAGQFIASIGKFGLSAGEFAKPHGIAVTSDGSLWAADTAAHRLQHISANGQFIGKIGNAGTLPSQFTNPQGIAVAADGSVWVADTFNHRMQHFGVTGEFISQFGDMGSAAGKFNTPYGVAIAADNSLWIVEFNNHRLQHFSGSGEFLAKVGNQGAGPGQFNYPESITIAIDGSVWVADTGNSRIQHFSAKGEFMEKFGKQGSLAGQLNKPSGIAVKADSSIWVADTGNDRLQHFSKTGEFLSQFGASGIAEGQFNSPGGIALAKDGSIWVAEFGNSRFQHFNVKNEVIDIIGSEGSAPGQFNSPNGIAASGEGSIWMADNFNHRLQKFVPLPKINAAPTNSGSVTIIHRYKAIILAGGGEKIGKRENDLWDSTWRVAKKAYSALSFQGFKVNDEILFLTAGNTQLPVDEKSSNLIAATKDNLRRAITEWAVDAQDVVLYLVDHGGADNFQINGNELLMAKDLNTWITELEKSIPGKVTLVIESCNSASFFKSLANPKRPRFVLASAKASQEAVLANDGLNSFSYYFWSEIMGGTQLEVAFNNAVQGISSIINQGERIEPQIDSDGNAQYTEQDLMTLNGYCLGNCNKTGSNPPVIGKLTPTAKTLNGATGLDLNFQVQHNQPLFEAWALVQRPDDLSINPNKPLKFEKIPLSCDANDQCTGRYDRFDLKGEYLINYYASDFLVGDTNPHSVSPPETLKVTQSQGKATPPVEYDDKETTIYLRDVKVGDTHYQAALQEQNGQYVLLPGSAKAAPTLFNPPAVFDTDSNTINIPSARAFGQNCQATLKHLGNYVFNLQQADCK